MVTAPIQPQTCLSPEDYLVYEAAAEEKHEYYDGELVEMAGASINHNRIVRNIVVDLSLALKGMEYEVFSSDMRLWVPSRATYTYPDVMVIAGAPQCHDDRRDTIVNPLLLIEVLSKTTGDKDRGEKFVGYREIPTLRDYLIIDQSRCLVEHFARVERHKWLLTPYQEMQQTVSLSFEAVCLAVHDIYERVEFASPAKEEKEAGEEEGEGGK